MEGNGKEALLICTNTTTGVLLSDRNKTYPTIQTLSDWSPIRLTRAMHTFSYGYPPNFRWDCALESWPQTTEKHHKSLCISDLRILPDVNQGAILENTHELGK